MTLTIPTPRLLLVAHTPESALAHIEAMSPDQRKEVSPVWLERLRSLTEPDPWLLGYAMQLRETKDDIGGCGFKGPPADGVVEIAYGVEPAHRRQGYATEAAEALTAYAFGIPDVQIVCAHTLPAENASTHILRKCGFVNVGEVMDPEDGRVWRWERQRSNLSGTRE